MTTTSGSSPKDFESDATLPKAPVHICSACGKAFRFGELICPHCATPFSGAATAGKTRRVGKTGAIPDWKSWQRDNTNIRDVTVVLEIGDQELILPNAKDLVLGRATTRTSSAEAPQVDLEPFGAEEKGVSRHHLKISRDLLIYAADLGSTNGTFLNGQRLFANSDCPLNDGDDLWIGRLKVRVHFRRA